MAIAALEKPLRCPLAMAPSSLVTASNASDIFPTLGMVAENCVAAPEQNQKSTKLASEDVSRPGET